MTLQRSFFDDEPQSVPVPAPAPWEVDDLRHRKIARIAFPTGYDAVLDYLIPGELAGRIEPGMRVMVPLGRGNRSVPGYCVDVVDYGMTGLLENPRLKSVTSLIDPRRLIGDKMLGLARWIAAKYLCPIGQVLEAVLPAGVRSHAGTRLVTVLFPVEDVEQRLEIQRVREGLTPKQLHVLETLRSSGEPLSMVELQRAAKCSAVPINALKTLGLIRAETIRRKKPETETASITLEGDPHRLNPDQRRALETITDAVENRRHETFLLHGVTGSGKTEVYIQAIRQVVRFGRQAIVLVPEISLTPQTVDRFKSRFPDVAVLHSHLTDAERHRQWTSIAEGEVQVVVGARSAVFAPLKRLGLIVIDEEHENSFKQDTAPRYHARDVARKRAEDERCPLILGSATPSLESWHASQAASSTSSIMDATSSSANISESHRTVFAPARKS